MVQMEHHHKRPVQGHTKGQNDRQGTAGRPNLRPRIPTIPTLRLRMPTVTLPNLRLNRPSFSNLRQNLRDMVPTLRPLNLPSAPVFRPQAPLTLRRPQPQPGGIRRPPAGPAAVARPAIPASTSSRPAPLLTSTAAAAGPVSPAAPQSTSIRPTLGFEDSTFRNQANPILPEPIEFNSVFDSNADPFAEFRDEDFGDTASFRELLDAQFGDFQFNKIKRKDN